MKLIIHRGAKEIGGSCVELTTAKSRIVIDFGIPLVNGNRQRFDSKVLAAATIDELKLQKILPNIEGLYLGQERNIDAIFISHSHMDHYGFLRYVHPDIPVYMSEGANILIEVSSLFTPCKVGRLNVRILNKSESLQVGDFTVSNQLVDHSAFDALAFMIEADGRKIFYSGDFRSHGRKGGLFSRMIAYPPAGVDCLLLEGSMIGRRDHTFNDESAVEQGIVNILKSNNNIKFLFASSQNIDRIVSAYRACLKAEHTFVIDLYTAYILDKLRKVSKNIPQFDWRKVRVKFLKSHADTLADNVSKELLYLYNTRKIEFEEINSNKGKILMLARDNSFFPILTKNIQDIAGAKLIYSMWDGYLTERFVRLCGDSGITIEYVHTSGHAAVKDLQAFASAINPKVLIPIHAFEAGEYPNLFKNVMVLDDGAAFELG